MKSTTGLSNVFNWGILIAVFAFLVGIGAGSQLVASVFALRGKQNVEGIITILQAVAVAGGIGAGIAIVIDLGSPLHLLSMILTPNVASPLFWDMMGLSSFILFAVLAFVARIRNWKTAKTMMILAGLSALALQIIEGLMFALIEARAWWNSPITAVDFLVVAVVCGLATALVIGLLKRVDYTIFAKPLSIAICLHVVLSLAEVAHLAFGETALEQLTFSSLVTFAPLYLVELVLPLLAAFLLFLRSNKGSLDAKCGMICGALVFVGMLAHRLMLLYPAYYTPTLSLGLSNAGSQQWVYPMSTGMYSQSDFVFALNHLYIPAIPEMLSILLPIGAAVFIVVAGLVVIDKLSSN